MAPSWFLAWHLATRPHRLEAAMERPVARVFNLIDPESQRISGRSVLEAQELLAARGSAGLRQVHGSFALVARDGERVLLARSLDRPMRYFLAKEEAGPALIVAERIDEIRKQLETPFRGGLVSARRARKTIVTSLSRPERMTFATRSWVA